ncbi:hypothetical protein K7X08_021087 [Anisodus acutangulus]|uniref:Thioredoxin domain-containing protein n=1 Tax=Anisodus acutangulus TaxID=402998 RepID=A0A9Q1RB45_9SOLA|nr:hypothetical protein K7X08_021087 [Anisodus acutangulus]
MGANYSTTWPETNNMPITPQIKRSQVIAFHSSTKWKLHFGSLKDTNKLVVIDFTATWCGPCKYMEPVINDFAAKYTDVEFIKIDVDELADVAQEYGVQAMPSFVLIRKGKVVIDFTAAWCCPCKYMEPVLTDFAAKYTDVEFVKIDVDELADVAQEYGVQAMPTFMLIK